MFRAMEEIHQEFEKVGFHHEVKNYGDQWILEARVSTDVTRYLVLMLVNDADSNDLAIRIFHVAHCPQEKRTAVLEVLNDLQLQYRFLRLNLTPEGDVNVEYDFPSSGTSVGPAAVEMMVRTMDMVDEFYAAIMAVIEG